MESKKKHYGLFFLTILVLTLLPLISAVTLEDTILKTSDNLIQITIDGNGILTTDQVEIGSNYVYIENGIYLKDNVEWDCGTKNVTAYGLYELQEIGCNVVSTGTGAGGSTPTTPTETPTEPVIEDNSVVVDLKTINLAEMKITYDNWTKFTENRIKVEIFDLSNNYIDPTNISIKVLGDVLYKKTIVKQDVGIYTGRINIIDNLDSVKLLITVEEQGKQISQEVEIQLEELSTRDRMNKNALDMFQNLSDWIMANMFIVFLIILGLTIIYVILKLA